MEALFARAARLVKVDYAAPPPVIGKTTVGGLQSGLVYGFAGQVDGIVGRIRAELGVEAPAIATGGLADLVAPHTQVDRARRPVPHARRPAHGLGAERVISDPSAPRRLRGRGARAPHRPRAGGALRRRALDPSGAARRARLGPRDPRRHARAHRGGDGRAVGAHRLVGGRVHAVKAAGAVYLVGLGLWTILARRAEPEVALGGERRSACLRPGDRRERPQPEDRALLPRVPAAVRRPERGASLRVEVAFLGLLFAAARARHRLDLGARRRVGRRRCCGARRGS